jgi:putative transposase
MPSGMPVKPKKGSALAAAFMAIPPRHANADRVKAGVRTFFVTSSILGKRNLLQSDRAAELFLRVLYDYRAQGKFRLHDFVVMPDHFHLLLTVGSEMTIERAVQFIKGGFSFRAGKELGMRSPVWQEGFSEVRITHPEGFLQVRTYIRNNPAMRHLIVEPRDYPYSSAHPGFELDPPPEWQAADLECQPKGRARIRGRRFAQTSKKKAAEAG